MVTFIHNVITIGIIKDCIGIEFQWKIEKDMLKLEEKINQFYDWSHLVSLMGRLRRVGRYIIELYFWPHRLMVRTPGFHPGNLSSILGGATRVVVQSGSIRALGARGRRFKSYLPDYEHG